jgi:Di-haem oxidoreductase, putative peroxidase
MTAAIRKVRAIRTATAYMMKKAARLVKGQPRWRVGVVLALVTFGSGVSAWALITGSGDRTIVQNVEGTVIGSIGGHIVQATLTNQVIAGNNAQAFADAVETGDQLFQARFNAADGGGANVGQGSRFTRMPRADLTGSGQWASHVPARATGPNATGCTGCHLLGGDDGAGDAADNVHRDANHTKALNQMVTRNTPHLFGLGGLQKLAEDMTTDLQNARNAARTAIGCGTTTTAGTRTVTLISKGVAFGTLVITHTGGSTTCSEALSAPVSGGAKSLSADLVVRPYQWKGVVTFVRDFVRGAGHNELGMQGTELLGSPTVDPATVDGDGDGVKNELFVGDITALTLYNANQPRPTTRQELASLGIIPALTSQENSDIAAGSTVFDQLGCQSCHVRQLVANDIIFREPSANANFRDAGNLFPNGRSYGASALDIAHPITFDITRDQQENADITTANGQKLGSFVRDAQGHAVIALFGDLRRHDMGRGLDEEVDEVGTGKNVFMTENLWGVGTTAPYLHDGRAVTLTEAILEHGGESQASRDAFAAAGTTSQKRLVAFLNNQVLFKAAE